MYYLDPAVFHLKRMRDGNGLGIFIEYHQRGLRGQARQQVTAMPTATERAIHKHAMRLRQWPDRCLATLDLGSEIGINESRSEARRAGKECVRTCRSRRLPCD